MSEKSGSLKLKMVLHESDDEVDKGDDCVYKRPFLDEFMKFCFEKFEVGIWRNFNGILNVAMGTLRNRLLFIWALDNENNPLFLVELKKLWDKDDSSLPLPKGRYSSSNTLLIDYRPYKALLNPSNTAIFPHQYDAKAVIDDSLASSGTCLAELLSRVGKEGPFPEIYEFVALSPRYSISLHYSGDRRLVNEGDIKKHSVFHGEPSLFFSYEKLDNSAAPFRLALISKCAYSRPSIYALRNYLKKWEACLLHQVDTRSLNLGLRMLLVIQILRRLVELLIPYIDPRFAVIGAASNELEGMVIADTFIPLVIVTMGLHVNGSDIISILNGEFPTQTSIVIQGETNQLFLEEHFDMLEALLSKKPRCVSLSLEEPLAEPDFKLNDGCKSTSRIVSTTSSLIVEDFISTCKEFSSKIDGSIWLRKVDGAKGKEDGAKGKRGEKGQKKKREDGAKGNVDGAKGKEDGAKGKEDGAKGKRWMMRKAREERNGRRRRERMVLKAKRMVDGVKGKEDGAKGKRGEKGQKKKREDGAKGKEDGAKDKRWMMRKAREERKGRRRRGRMVLKAKRMVLKAKDG
ncbi:hypothetical protein HHK36_018087 [Tetracentron sinense]|uniref:Mitochondrial import inner membrane translocase subunit TIM50 n=1 Tax=Tetracentron sinense TaxID=13715 RepID=A0A834YVB8_TETSI|nr:hypothetical protein HHK36_018087 [Tetracentron sinense]